MTGPLHSRAPSTAACTNLPKTVAPEVPLWLGTGSQGSGCSSGGLGGWWCSWRETCLSSGAWLLVSMLWCVAPSYTRVHLGSTNQRVKNRGCEVGSRPGWWSERRWRGKVRGRYYQNILYTCTHFSKNKQKCIDRSIIS